MDAKQVDYRYFERPYFLIPANELAGEGFVVIRDALKKTGKVGLAQLTMVDLAVQLIEQKAGNFDAGKFEDRFATALKALVSAKLKGKSTIVAPEESRPTGTNVVDLMAALKRSLAKTGGPQSSTLDRVLDASDECWTFSNRDIRACKNITLGRIHVNMPQARPISAPASPTPVANPPVEPGNGRANGANRSSPARK